VVVEDVVNTFALLAANRLGVQSAAIGARATLWIRDPSNLWQLRSTKYRWERGAQQPSARSSTVYSLRGRGVGAPGMAYLKRGRECVIVRDLPIFGDDPSGYERRVAHLGLTGEAIRSWSRHSRSMMSAKFPFKVNQDGLEPFGVVCVDCMEPFDTASDEELATIMEDLMKEVGNELTLIWKNRI